MTIRKDITGKRFGRLVVLGFDYRKTIIDKKRYKYYWKCKCDCGNIIDVDYCNLVINKVQSCGCLRKETTKKRMTTHGLSKHRLMGIYRDMKKRCKFNPHYAGRGICLYDEWNNDFLSFYNWAMQNGYKEDLTIERKNVNGNYCPENCCWIPLGEQSKNTTRTHHITINGETKCLSDWCRLLGLNYKKMSAKKLSDEDYAKELEEIICLG